LGAAPIKESSMADTTKTAVVAGPWVAEARVCEDAEERGVAVVAVVPEVHRNGFDTPTRGIVAWVHSGIGACATDDQAVATATLIASAPDMRDEIERLRDERDKFERAWNDVSDRYEALLNQLGGTDA
jgi:hypothetical protein